MVMSNGLRRGVAAAAGVLIILLALGALLLPLEHGFPRRLVVGWLLIPAGAFELAAALVRRGHRPSAAVAAVATLLAGLRLVVDPHAGFFPVLNLVILWLVVRSVALLFSTYCTRSPLASWTGFAAATDLLLAVLLLAGAPIALLVVSLFGPTPSIVATFAWVFGLSFVATGAMLLAVSATDDASPA
jgi:uncharacterized membrane protein HdeD (DUF308 family)